MKRSGFTLIEVAIGSLVGSLLLASLYMTINTLSKTMFKLNERHDEVNELMIAYDLLEKDLTAQYVPLDLMKTGTQQIDPDLGFVCLAKDKKIDYLSCVSMHTRPQYNSVKSAPVRVVYQCIYNKDKTALKLNRFESNTLAWSKCKKEIEEKKIKGLVVSDAMTEFDVALFAYSRVEKPKNESDKKYSTHKQWDPEDIYKKTKRLIPDYMSLNGALGDENYYLDFAFDFGIVVHDPEPAEPKQIPQKTPETAPKPPQVAPNLPQPPRGNSSISITTTVSTPGSAPTPPIKDVNGKPA